MTLSWNTCIETTALIWYPRAIIRQRHNQDRCLLRLDSLCISAWQAVLDFSVCEVAHRIVVFSDVDNLKGTDFLGAQICFGAAVELAHSVLLIEAVKRTYVQLSNATLRVMLPPGINPALAFSDYSSCCAHPSIYRRLAPSRAVALCYMSGLPTYHLVRSP